MNVATRLARAGLELSLRCAEAGHGIASSWWGRGLGSRHGAGAGSPPSPSRLAEILQQAEEGLAENVLPFWARHAPDREHGGFITHLDRVGRHLGPTDKYLVMQARLIWTMAAAHRHGLTGQGYLDLGGQGVQFLIERMWDAEHGGFVWTVRRDGDPLDRRKLLYGQAFAIYALAEYAIAAGDPSALTWAETTLEILRRRAGDGHLGFREQFARDWTPLPGAAGTRKTLNAHLHLLEAMTTLVEASRNPAHAAEVRQLLDIILTRAIHPRQRCAREYFDWAWRPEPHWKRRTSISYGHGVEAAWLALRAVDVLGEDREPLRQPVLGLIDHALAYGFDHARGGLARYGPPVGDARAAVYLGRDRLTKHWWEQAEMLVATIEAYRWTGQSRYGVAFDKQFDWVWRRQIDHQGGDWFGATAWRDGRPLCLDKGDNWKDSYHGARALMEVSRRLRVVASAAHQLANPVDDSVH
jgi:mannose/cellobiose epimerase-like protein (N-acyl-D-glucosamine 2-epimerase family)